jgi:hypothetical protein
MENTIKYIFDNELYSIFLIKETKNCLFLFFIYSKKNSIHENRKILRI